MSRPLVILFDIDGTLIESAGAGGGALLHALELEFGSDQAEPVALHGRTDLGIMSELLEKHGIAASPVAIQRLANRYFSLLPEELKRRTGKVLPGVLPLLEHLEQQVDIELGLLTGNMPTSAQMKLEHYGLWHFFDFGIYGDQAAERPQLAQPAIQLIAAQLQQTIPSEQIVIVGDTPLDIELAIAMDAKSIGVCTGGYSVSDLTQAGATKLLTDLQDTQAILQWLLE